MTESKDMTAIYGLGPGKIERRRRPPRVPKGRKFVMTAALFGAPFVTTTAALFTDRMTAETYVGFLNISLPLALAAFLGANVAQKVGLARAGASAETPASSTSVGVP